ncbi:hypothetical protein FGG08_002918 [Glutinoglossum americanum]|uniref:CSN8/PSMD8/EIF3K domain-containing protein n=1 Tax=Glutinoglossum americanum TaxID=1670608 RepID=A0A9P8IC07_9PEZI|nr:hypothetical protein FGG08_002918 [Glutinoglossum americanum]
MPSRTRGTISLDTNDLRAVPAPTLITDARRSIIVTDVRSAQRPPWAFWSMGQAKARLAGPSREHGVAIKRLLDYKTQESYYNKIVERYMSFCADSGGGSELERQFASLSLQAGGTGAGDESVVLASKQAPATTATATTAPVAVPANSQSHEKTLSILILAMRKLREGLTASSRLDPFTTRFYIFCIRTTILLKHTASYHPALLHLLRHLHPHDPLPPAELHEFIGYHLLDLACRQNDLPQAFATRNHYRYADRRVDAVLRALAHDNYHLFWRVRGEVDGYQAGLMGWAEEEMKVLALKCLGRAYVCVEGGFLGRVTGGEEWEALKGKYGVGWELRGDGMVVIRKPKAPSVG